MGRLLILFFLYISSIYSSNICLTLIVKDDETQIEKCLASVQDIIDCICVCDIGSSDRTVEKVQAFMKQTGLYGKIHQHEWINFGYNRTRAIKEAQKMVRERGFESSDTYLLIVDANKIFHVDEAFDKNELKKDAYLVLEKSASLSCYSYNLQLLKASLPWKSFGAIYDYWSAGQKYQSEKLQTLTIEDQRNDPGKIYEEVELLRIEIEKNPNDERCIFYLAQLYKALKQYDQAIVWYKKRIEFKGDSEEIWFSKYMLGQCYKDLGRWDAALYWFLEAYQFSPDRTDSLLDIATYYRLQGKNDLAYIFSSYGVKIPPAVEQIFFTLPPSHHYRFDEELSIAAYYTRNKERGFESADNLILTRDAPWHVKSQTYRNILFYVQKLPHTRWMPIVCDLPLIQQGNDEKYHPMNPSICKTSTGYQVICRSVNYTQTGAKFFKTIDPEGIIRTRNFLLHYNSNMELLSQNEIVESLPRYKFHTWRSENVKGFEDCRIFEFGEKTWCTCTTFDTNPSGMPQISLCSLDELNNVDKLVPLLGPHPTGCEKNWLPFIKDGHLLLIYSYDPFVVYKPYLEDGSCRIFFTYKPTRDFSSFRGSAAPIPFGEGYLMLVHEVVHMEDHTRRYLHRFVYLDSGLVIQKYSKPFIFQHLGIEFCTSMTMDHDQKHLILAVGIEDREAHLCFVDLETIRSLMTTDATEVD